MPIEDFAGRLQHGKSRVAPLQLIVDAVDRTRDYSVFGSQLMQMLIDFKWHGYASTIFYRQLALHSIHVLIVLAFNVRIAITFRYLPDPLGRSEYTNGNPDGVILLGLVWTSVQCVRGFVTETWQLCISGARVYFGNGWNCLDILYVFAQAMINVLYCTRKMVPDWLTVQYNLTEVDHTAGRRLKGKPLQNGKGVDLHRNFGL